jgi:aryl carrier-like protein
MAQDPCHPCLQGWLQTLFTEHPHLDDTGSMSPMSAGLLTEHPHLDDTGSMSPMSAGLLTEHPHLDDTGSMSSMSAELAADTIKQSIHTWMTQDPCHPCLQGWLQTLLTEHPHMDDTGSMSSMSAELAADTTVSRLASHSQRPGSMTGCQDPCLQGWLLALLTQHPH